jgi:hypothetical protein
VSYPYPTNATIYTVMLDMYVKECDYILTLIDKMATEHAAHRGEVKAYEPWLKICAIVCQVFRELRNVRQNKAGAFNLSDTHRIGELWWYIQQTHLKMAKFMACEFHRQPVITPVFTSHLDRFRIIGRQLQG